MRSSAIGHVVYGLAVVGLVTALSAAPSAQSPANPASSFPPAVLKAFQQSYPAATISTTSQQRDGGQTVFRVESVDKGRRRIVLYDSGGRVLEVAEQVDEKDLPQPVAAAMHSHPRAIYGSGTKVTRGGSVLYHLTLKGTRKTAMIAKPDGTVVSFK